MSTAHTMTKSEVLTQVRQILDDAGLTVDEFVEAGRSNRLVDAELRDLWLLIGTVIAGD